jgi:rare lipoprotein A
MNTRLSTLLAIFIALTAASCAKKKNSSASANAVPPPPTRLARIGDSEVGLASWYGHPYHGRAAANGEIFDMNAKTAAHRTMPFGTWVKVVNLSNGKSVDVRITDRGPFVEGRIIDLSRKAAEEISMIGPGVVKVKLTVAPTPDGEVDEKYGVQLGAFASREEGKSMERRAKELGEQTGFHCAASPKDGVPPCKLVAGRGTREEAVSLRDKFRQAGLRGFVVRLDLLELQPADGGRTSPK